MPKPLEHPYPEPLRWLSAGGISDSSLGPDRCLIRSESRSAVPTDSAILSEHMDVGLAHDPVTEASARGSGRAFAWGCR